MMSDEERILIRRAAATPASEIRRNLNQLYQKCDCCTDLARTCLTEEAREILLVMANEARAGAAELEGALTKLTELHAESTN